MKALRPAPKPQRPERGTAECRRYMSLVAQLDCIGCGRSDVQLHHPIMGRHSQGKTSDLDVIPVCPDCHDMIHNHRSTWLLTRKPDTEYIPQVRKAAERLLRATIGGRR